jgi:hypothetical protein
MGVHFKTAIWFWDETGLPGATARARLPAPFPFHEDRKFCCLAASLRPAEEAVCSFVVNAP